MVLQVFIIVTGLIGQLLITRKDARGYLAWIAGNLALIIVYHQTQQFWLIAWQIANITLQVTALVVWLKEAKPQASQRAMAQDGNIAALQ
ncbi:hypothetical protein [Nitrosospira sp. NpAV]|uniref:hypothetical protein n=1 Tax=Nitrosospira sp. NpAV TaxID=58133 RepID=UPI000AB06065|nr:hypothetical protein [Nitrosospira sp. NpAV]